MGIPGLLPLLSQISKTNTPLKEFAHKTIGIDGHAWLHRAAYACAYDIGLSELGNKQARIRACTAISQYFVNRLIQMKSIGISGYIVLDGQTPPLKIKYTSCTRYQIRTLALKQAQKYLKLNQMDLATKAFQTSISIHRWMVKAVIDVCQTLGVPYIVSVYEADPQLVYLERIGVVDCILTEDSDLLVLGARTLLLKLNLKDLTCTLVNGKLLFTHVTSPCSLYNWTLPRLVDWAILSGCDFLPGLPGIGIKRAYSALSSIIQLDSRKNTPQLDEDQTTFALLDAIHPSLNSVSHRYRTDTISRALSSLLHLQSTTKDLNFKEYLEIATKARLAFRHPRIWCPISHSLVCLYPWPSEHDPHFKHVQSDYSLLGLNNVVIDRDPTLSDIIGPWFHPSLAYQIVNGYTDPITLKAYLPTDLNRTELHAMVKAWHGVPTSPSGSSVLILEPDSGMALDEEGFVEFREDSVGLDSIGVSHTDCNNAVLDSPTLPSCNSHPYLNVLSSPTPKLPPPRNLFQVQIPPDLENQK